MSVVDIHVHVGGLERKKTGCFMSSAQAKHLRREMPPFLNFQFHIGEWLGILDSQVQKRLLGFIEEAREVDYACVLAFDGIYDRDGRLDEKETCFYVPNEYVLGMAKLSRKVIPAVSINPMRRDWEEEMDKCFSSGARFIKWLPSSQAFDPADPKFLPFYKKIANRRIPLLSHTGYEHTIISCYKEDRQKLGEPKRLIPALEAGVTVIMAHAGTSGGDEPDYFEDFVSLCKTFPNLYGDTAAFTHISRAEFIANLFKKPIAFERFVHGSDATLQPSLWAFESLVGRELIEELRKIENPLIKDVRLKKALGFPEEVFTRGAKILGIN